MLSTRLAPILPRCIVCALHWQCAACCCLVLHVWPLHITCCALGPMTAGSATRHASKSHEYELRQLRGFGEDRWGAFGQF